MGTKLLVMVLMIQVAKNEGVFNKKKGLVNSARADEETDVTTPPPTTPPPTTPPPPPYYTKDEIDRQFGAVKHLLRTELRDLVNWRVPELAWKVLQNKKELKKEINETRIALKEVMKIATENRIKFRCISASEKWECAPNCGNRRHTEEKRRIFNPPFSSSPTITYGLTGVGWTGNYLKHKNLNASQVVFYIGPRHDTAWSAIEMYWMVCGY